jgi:hypothetical protein
MKSKQWKDICIRKQRLQEKHDKDHYDMEPWRKRSRKKEGNSARMLLNVKNEIKD